MNAFVHLVIFCILLDFQLVFCTEFAKREYPLLGSNGQDEISGGDFFKFLLNSKQRRSVKSVGDGGLHASKQTRQIRPQFECGDRVLNLFLKQADVVNLRIRGRKCKQNILNHTVNSQTTKLQVIFMSANNNLWKFRTYFVSSH